jgi:hypothetical protein
MSVIEFDTEEIVRASYRIAWKQFNMLPLTPDEKIGGCEKMREYIQLLVATGERDLEKISASALGLIREYHQIRRSEATLTVAGGQNGAVPMAATGQ